LNLYLLRKGHARCKAEMVSRLKMEVCGRQARRLLGVFLPRVEQRGEAVRDPRRHFATVNCRIAKGLFNHLVGDGENRRRHLDADRSRRLQVDDELEFG